MNDTQKPDVIAWTGGDSPPLPSASSRKHASIQKYLFGEQVDTFFRYWHDYPNYDTLRIFFRRARYDAWATVRK